MDDAPQEDSTVPPYIWEDGQSMNEDEMKLLQDVADQLEQHATVVWTSAVRSLDLVKHHLRSCKDARDFVEKYMQQIIGILVEQQPNKIGGFERKCVQESLSEAIMIISLDLQIQIERGPAAVCKTLDVLSTIFNKKKVYYKVHKGNWTVNHFTGLPETRTKMIDLFRQEQGFQRLYTYMIQRMENGSLDPMCENGTTNGDTPPDMNMEAVEPAPEISKDQSTITSSAGKAHSEIKKATVGAGFPTVEQLHHVLVALAESIPNPRNTMAAAKNRNIEAQQQPNSANDKDIEDRAIEIAKATMQYIGNSSEDDLKTIPTEQLTQVQSALQKIFDRLVINRRENTYEYYAFWRSLIWKLITSKSLPLKLFGWQQVDDILMASGFHRPPPRSYLAEGAGCSFANGIYLYSGATTPDGYALGGSDVNYERIIPDDVEDGGGKKLTLFRCTMRSQQKWWFLSEADEEQPGTDRDIDYYQHKSKEHEEIEPPRDGWITCRNAGIDPPPTLLKQGRMVPDGEEFNTLEHQLAKWAIENDIMELVLGDSVHRETVARSTPLIKFLASMCERDEGVTSGGGKVPNQHCLQLSHLLLAWKTCTRKTDAAVSAQIYQLLVSILPSCPACLAIPLLKEIKESLVQPNKDKQDYLVEVADFCTALAVANPVDGTKGGTMILSNEVRAEVLELLWQVLMHPEASSLKSYDILKGYVNCELGVEPEGTKHREKYLESCIAILTLNSKQIAGGSIDETQALKIVKLTHFVLEACNRQQAAELAVNGTGSLPFLLFDELVSFLKRRQNGNTPQASLRKSPSVGSETKEGKNSLSIRLKIMRYVFGMNEQIRIGSAHLNQLWQLCCAPADREELMVFIASASGMSSPRSPHVSIHQPLGPLPQGAAAVDERLSPAIADDVCAEAFLSLFCAADFQLLGESAYQSFQSLSRKMRASPSSGEQAKKATLDALWRICLVAKNNSVASHAMNDLLEIYSSIAEHSTEPNSMPIEPAQTESFGKRVYDCLTEVKACLDRRDSSAELAAERCLRILNAAIGESSNSMTTSTLIRLASIPSDKGIDEVAKMLPHGMRGQSYYTKVGVLVKRTTQSQGQNAYQDRDTANSNQGRNGSTHRFTLDVHPLETLSSIKAKVGTKCQCPNSSVKPISITGRASSNGGRTGNDSNLNTVPEDMVVDELGIAPGCELVFIIADRQNAQQSMNHNTAMSSRNTRPGVMNELFRADSDDFADKLFNTLLGILDSLPGRESNEMSDGSQALSDSHYLVWELIFAMPTNASISSQVFAAASIDSARVPPKSQDAMEIDSRHSVKWSSLLNMDSFHRSVYVLLAIDAFLQPAVEVLSSLPKEQRLKLEDETKEASILFRQGFIDSGGLDAVVKFFSFSEESPAMSQSMTRLGNAVVLRILKCCLFGDCQFARKSEIQPNDLDEAGKNVLNSLADAKGLLRSLTSMVVADSGISSSAVSDVLKLLHLLLKSDETAQNFIALPNNIAQKFLVALLLWEGGSESSRSEISSALKVRKNTRDAVLSTPILSTYALSWLRNAFDSIDVTSDSTAEYFELLESLVSGEHPDRIATVSKSEMAALATAVCKKLASCPRPASDALAVIDFSTGVLCGCLSLLRALIESSAHNGILLEGTRVLLQEFHAKPWSESMNSEVKPDTDDACLLDLMGVIFDAFLSPGGATSVVAICCDKPSRQRGFDVVVSAARHCTNGNGYNGLVHRINDIISSAAPYLKHRWGQSVNSGEVGTRHGRTTSKYSGLRNQGCTCYMNSFLQQMFMRPELRKSLCSASLPASVRASGAIMSARGAELVGKKVSMQWENGNSYDAQVEAFDENTGMHTIRYVPIVLATIAGTNHQQLNPEEINKLPPIFPDEFFLSEGRPGKETGVFEDVAIDSATDGGNSTEYSKDKEVEETEDEANSRRLMEEVQRTFIHLEEGSRGRCFDPRALVEACACLKLEFDVWQQNDASEFATKLLDRLEISLKKWAPEHFHYLHHTFGLKQTKQKICKECGLKTNREEPHMNIDCQIRGKSDVHEALSSLCETEIMEGNNQVFCDNCKKNTDTVLRTTISELPNMMILSLKRFDLDYTTFETVKLNSRCAFGQTLNMKRYTLEGVEAMEQAEQESEETDSMDIGSEESAMKHLPDEEYEYKLVGVLVHAGVAQGGHYYSFIKDPSDDKWYRFDDEDITPFDPALIEVECFGGKVKKETKWPNGQVHTVESEQYANALMLFYEKVKPKKQPPLPPRQESEKLKITDLTNIKMTSGYDVFEQDVRKSNATHRWQSFLFDAEFQQFLTGLLGFCRISISDGITTSLEDSVVTPAAAPLWRRNLIRMLLTFLFDVLLYSNDKANFGDWILQIEQIMAADVESAEDFVVTLALKSSQVSSNWLRTFLLDCPDQTARLAGVRVFSQAIESALASQEQQKKLEGWITAWKEQLAKAEAAGIPLPPPAMLQNEWATFEDINSELSSASAIGLILSFTNCLVDAIPRSWRFSPELFFFIRTLATIDTSKGGSFLREAMIQCLLPPRLICVVSRGRAPSMLRNLFPAASLQQDVAETQMRPEQNPHSHQMMSMAGNQVLNPADVNLRGGNSPFDYVYLFEAIACLMGITHVVQAPLITEHEETGRGRNRVVLTEPAKNALREIFRENCSENSPGMGQKEIEVYLRRSGVDNISSQKIMEMMAKFPSTTGNPGSKGVNFLSLEGFLAYYRDYSQSNEAKVRRDLRISGFRPDLSRRPENCRIVSGRDGRQKECSFPESIVLDVYAMFRETSPSLGQLGDIGMTTFYFHEVACNANEELGEYLLASTCLRASQNSQDMSSSIIILALRTIFQSTSSWNANEILSGIMVMLKVVASIPDELQKDRIRQIMLFNDRDPPNGSKPLGLLAAASHIYNSRSQQTYQQDMVFAYERYVGLVKELIYLRGVMEWMNEHRQLWSFMERDLLDTHHHPGYRQPRGGYSAPREPDDGGISLDQHHHSDSDGMHGIHDSEEEDEESRVEEMEFYNEGPAAVAITGAGNAAVNGLYVKDGHHDGTFKYSRTGEHQGERAIYSIFKCNVSNNTKHWYISVVPHGAQPGTSSDIDFYSAPVSNESNELPPLSGWVKAHEGTEPLPTLTYRDSTVDESPTAVGYEEWSDDQGINAPTSYV